MLFSSPHSCYMTRPSHDFNIVVKELFDMLIVTISKSMMLCGDLYVPPVKVSDVSEGHRLGLQLPF
jgi:hypothetical protein